MSPKPSTMRASAKGSLAKMPGISLGSHNECSITYQNRIQTQSAGHRLAAYTAGERDAIAARFWARVKKSTHCWLWTGSATGSGSTQHGQVVLPRRGRVQAHVYAHRLSWELVYGPIPAGLQVCHRCDVPRCVRPEHLFLGTQDDNLKDAARKGRFHTSRTKKLTFADRLTIYAMPDRRGIVVELALRYRVSKACITAIRSGRFVGAPFSFSAVFESVPHINLPVRGEVS